MLWETRYRKRATLTLQQLKYQLGYSKITNEAFYMTLMLKIERSGINWRIDGNVTYLFVNTFIHIHLIFYWLNFSIH